MKKTFKEVCNYLKQPKKQNLNHWKFFTVAMGLLLITMLYLDHRYERAIFVTGFTVIVFLLLNIKEKQKINNKNRSSAE